MTNNNKLSAIDILIQNIEMLKKEAGNMSNRELSRRSGVSDRAIGKTLNKESAPAVDNVEKIAKAFGLESWQLMLPNLRADMKRSGHLDQLIADYMDSDDEGRRWIERAASKEAGSS